MRKKHSQQRLQSRPRAFFLPDQSSHSEPLSRAPLEAYVQLRRQNFVKLSRFWRTPALEKSVPSGSHVRRIPLQFLSKKTQILSHGRTIFAHKRSSAKDTICRHRNRNTVRIKRLCTIGFLHWLIVFLTIDKNFNYLSLQSNLLVPFWLTVFLPINKNLISYLFNPMFAFHYLLFSL